MALKTEFLRSDAEAVAALRKVPEEQFYVTCGGRIVQDWEKLPEEANIHVHLRLRGGKGGFGSLLRSFRIHKSTNQLMCRDLNGRRIRDVKEEEKLRKWIAKAEEREKEKAAKKKAKYEKLKAGPPKHEFTDVEYRKKHDELEERTDEAFEAGLVTLEEEPKEKKPAEKIESSDDSDSDFEGLDVPGPSWLTKKRKRKAEMVVVSEKKPKFEEEVVVEETKAAEEKPAAKSPSSDKENEAEKPKIVEEVPKVAPKVFEAINLDSMDSAAALEPLGLDHLKFELEQRGMKCGGNLTERAKRLFSVKGLTPDKYPKSVKAAPKKK
ncbi:hypothetical protein L596_017695 [Steinernema carpocapsae]|uniref:Uncharacterized protein n=1 Tax=Steinernema carpocapsae TaxID=34508 RepID=A0A4U5N2E4_STECR|nr:hypothetical protein L596_017695 [Steinernema carpocapsae]